MRQLDLRTLAQRLSVACVALPLPLMLGRASPQSLPGQLQPLAWWVFLAGVLALGARLVWPVAAHRPSVSARRPSLPEDDFQPTQIEPPRALAMPERVPASPPVLPPERLIPPAPTEVLSPPLDWGADFWRGLDASRFEALLIGLSEQAGFEVRRSPARTDGACDLLLHSRHQPDGAVVSLVRCHWSSDDKPLRLDKLRPLPALMAQHGISRAQVATTARVAVGAREFARKNSIHLLDVEGLTELLGQRSAAQQQALSDQAGRGPVVRAAGPAAGH